MSLSSSRITSSSSSSSSSAFAAVAAERDALRRLVDECLLPQIDRHYEEKLQQALSRPNPSPKKKEEDHEGEGVVRNRMVDVTTNTPLVLTANTATTTTSVVPTTTTPTHTGRQRRRRQPLIRSTPAEDHNDDDSDDDKDDEFNVSNIHTNNNSRNDNTAEAATTQLLLSQLRMALSALLLRTAPTLAVVAGNSRHGGDGGTGENSFNVKKLQGCDVDDDNESENSTGGSGGGCSSRVAGVDPYPLPGGPGTFSTSPQRTPHRHSHQPMPSTPVRTYVVGGHDGLTPLPTDEAAAAVDGAFLYRALAAILAQLPDELYH